MKIKFGKTIKQWGALCASLLLCISAISIVGFVVYFSKKDKVEIDAALGVLMASGFAATPLLGIAYGFFQYFRLGE